MDVCLYKWMYALITLPAELFVTLHMPCMYHMPYTYRMPYVPAYALYVSYAIYISYALRACICLVCIICHIHIVCLTCRSLPLLWLTFQPCICRDGPHALYVSCALNVGLKCRPYMSALYVGHICRPYMSALYVGLICRSLPLPWPTFR